MKKTECRDRHALPDPRSVLEGSVQRCQVCDQAFIRISRFSGVWEFTEPQPELPDGEEV